MSLKVKFKVLLPVSMVWKQRFFRWSELGSAHGQLVSLLLNEMALEGSEFRAALLDIAHKFFAHRHPSGTPTSADLHALMSYVVHELPVFWLGADLNGTLTTELVYPCFASAAGFVHDFFLNSLGRSLMNKLCNKIEVPLNSVSFILCSFPAVV
eukprot:TRINITY_DN17865_c0_g1_i1.p1 TRINITY_DN17865_c0_g1~~TRINITY_DN17865_c0_g1_i1.p1  ORF type:complete len:154 (+),score=19.46 TRINITY_DN17865_c0_g1_i1:77-538(+)